MYVVQATKGLPDETIDPENPAKSINSKMWMMPTLEERDKQLVIPRLARSYQLASNDAKKRAVEDHIALLPKIYESLVKMDQFAFTFSMQSQLAADLVMDPDFDGNDAQINALKQGTPRSSGDRFIVCCKSDCSFVSNHSFSFAFIIQVLVFERRRLNSGNRWGRLLGTWELKTRSIFSHTWYHALVVVTLNKSRHSLHLQRACSPPSRSFDPSAQACQNRMCKC